MGAAVARKPVVSATDERDTIEYLAGLDTRALVRQLAKYRGIAATRGLLPGERARMATIERVLGARNGSGR